MVNQTPVSCNATLIVTSHRVFQPDLNEHESVFGGKILSLVDDSASVSAVRLTHKTVVTASFDHVSFLQPFHIDDSMFLEAYVSGTGTRSLEVFVKIIGENLTTGERFVGYTCFITYVIEDRRATTPLPPVKPMTDEQRYIVAGYEKRSAQRKQRRAEQLELNGHVSVDSPWPI
ncbi:acyl-CoA thioesterase [Levilactobacillus fujinensis]|uniref:Acyl-CoA thioesterase n=1 Tax=Levilactobacillus fujinensis TaxID=2486024 RepID=A0ABW1TGE6_9LACO|nr:hotdog domain-containing protein [Levilactobacillus fujinensis]